MRSPTLKPPQEWSRKTENIRPHISKCLVDETGNTTPAVTAQAATRAVAMPVICVVVLCVVTAVVRLWAATVLDAYNVIGSDKNESQL